MPKIPDEKRSNLQKGRNLKFRIKDFIGIFQARSLLSYQKACFSKEGDMVEFSK
jgi:hypothetical protein